MPVVFPDGVRIGFPLFVLPGCLWCAEGRKREVMPCTHRSAFSAPPHPISPRPAVPHPAPPRLWDVRVLDSTYIVYRNSRMYAARTNCSMVCRIQNPGIYDGLGGAGRAKARRRGGRAGGAGRGGQGRTEAVRQWDDNPFRPPENRGQPSWTSFGSANKRNPI